MSDTWRRIVAGKAERKMMPERVDRQHFDACVFTQILWDLKTGDLYVEGSDRYANTWAQGISWETYTESRDAYGKMMDFPVDGLGFVAYLKTWLSTIAHETDQAFPNARVTIERGEPVIHKTPRRKSPMGLRNLEKLLVLKLKDSHILSTITQLFWHYPLSVSDLIAKKVSWLHLVQVHETYCMRACKKRETCSYQGC